MADPTATPQFKNSQLDELQARSQVVDPPSRRARHHLSNEKLHNIAEKKNMMFGFQKGKEIHMDQVRDRSKQQRGTTQIDHRQGKEGQPVGKKMN